MIPVVLVMAERQRLLVERLVDYCKTLDGTLIEVVEFGKDTAPNQHEAAHLSFRKVCRLFKDTAFFWLEPDSIPLKKGWKEGIASEWKKRGKPFLLPNLTGLSHFDNASGIGIYPAGTVDIVPEKKPDYPLLGWDGWLYSKRSESIAFTRLIQHSYGVYGENGILERRHSFPLDQAIIRRNALIFHADPGQALIPVTTQPLQPVGVHPMVVAPYQ